MAKATVDKSKGAAFSARQLVWLAVLLVALYVGSQMYASSSAPSSGATSKPKKDASSKKDNASLKKDHASPAKDAKKEQASEPPRAKEPAPAPIWAAPDSPLHSLGPKHHKHRMDALFSLVDWAVANGAFVNQTQVRLGYTRESGFGWVAREDIPAVPGKKNGVVHRKDIIVSVPRSLAITMGHLLDTHLAPLVDVVFPPNRVKYRERILLATYLVVCRFQVNCKWSKYVLALPPHIENPLSLSNEELEPYAPFQVVDSINVIRGGIEGLYQSIVGVAQEADVEFPPNSFSFEAFSWAWWVVGAHGIVKDDKLSLVPLVDLFNYDPEERPVLWSSEHKLFTVAPFRGVAAGSEVRVGYPQHYPDLSSWGWYSWTGWAPVSNDTSVESFPFHLPLKSLIQGPPEEDVLWDGRVQVVEAIGHFRDLAVTAHFATSLVMPGDVVALARVAAARNSEELTYLLENRGLNPMPADGSLDADRMDLDARALGALERFVDEAIKARTATNFDKEIESKFGKDENAPDRVRTLLRLLETEMGLLRRYHYLFKAQGKAAIDRIAMIRAQANPAAAAAAAAAAADAEAARAAEAATKTE